MKIKISKSQWEGIGKVAHWLDEPPKMMPGQKPYTKEELKRLHKMVGDAAKAEEHFTIDELEDYARQKKDDEVSRRRSIKVTFSDGDIVHTEINGTKAEIEQYYLNQEPTDTWGEKKLHKPVKVEFLG